MEICPLSEAQIRAAYPSYTTWTDTVRFSTTSSSTHRLYHRGIQVIQKVGVPVTKTVRNRSI